jgi:tRNA A37 N6-isopentenylltransferase MiaA
MTFKVEHIDKIDNDYIEQFTYHMIKYGYTTFEEVVDHLAPEKMSEYTDIRQQQIMRLLELAFANYVQYTKETSGDC